MAIVPSVVAVTESVNDFCTHNNKHVGLKNISGSLSRVVNICKGFLESSFAVPVSCVTRLFPIHTIHKYICARCRWHLIEMNDNIWYPFYILFRWLFSMWIWDDNIRKNSIHNSMACTIYSTFSCWNMEIGFGWIQFFMKKLSNWFHRQLAQFW